MSKPIKRQQFSRYDAFLHPECDNKFYLEAEEIKTGLSKETCYFGYVRDGQWITIKEAKECQN